MNLRIKKALTLAVVLFAAVSLHAQEYKVKLNPFHRLPNPEKILQSVKTYTLTAKGLDSTVVLKTFRFSTFAGYSLLSQKIQAGAGYGWERMHWVDSIQRYYVDYSVIGAILSGGPTTPDITHYTSIGCGVGLFNQKLIILPVYNLPNKSINGKGGFDVVISVGVPLN